VILGDPFHNHLIAALPEAELARWLPYFEPADMPLGAVIYESGCEMNAYVLSNHVHCFALVRDEKRCLGGDRGHRARRRCRFATYHGGGSTPSRALVQSAGEGFRLAA